MSSNTGAQMTMDAAEANNLLDLLYAHRDLLYQQTHQEEGGA